ncbi:MAG: SGNH/GDSL hydrolase family protein [Nitrospinae bacterium]|nr:SGNH/GDSL hydrolase family protein [Nitrospinota bacterium]
MADGNGDRLKKFLTNASLAVASIILVLAVTEGALRSARIYKDISKGRKVCRLSSNPRIGFEFIPGFTWKWLHVNSYGFRGPDFGQIKPENVFRIVVLGDSIAVAPYLPEEHLFANVLARKLNGNAPKTVRYEVLNAAVGGYDTWQELEVYKEKVRALKPDLVILGICQNDFVKNGNLSTDWAGIVRGDLDVDESGEKLAADIMIYRKIKQAIRTLNLANASKEDAGRYLAQLAPTLSKLWNEGGKPLAELSLALKNDGVKSLFVIFPYKFQMTESGRRSSDERFMEFCEQANQPCLDLFDVYRSNSDDLYIKNDHIHPSVKGHEITAEAIYRRIKDAGFIE